MYKIRALQEAKANEKSVEIGRVQTEETHLEQEKHQSTAATSSSNSSRGRPSGLAVAAASSSSGGHQQGRLRHGGEEGNVTSASASTGATATAAANLTLATMDYNYDHPRTKEAIHAMVAEEMRSFTPSHNYLSHLPYPHLKFANSAGLQDAYLRANKAREQTTASSSAAATGTSTAAAAAAAVPSSIPSKSDQRLATERLFHPASHQNAAMMMALWEELGLDSSDVSSAEAMLKIMKISHHICNDWLRV